MKKIFLILLFFFIFYSVGYVADPPSLQTALSIPNIGVGGVNRYFGDPTSIANNECWDIMNMEFSKKRMLRTRNGREKYNTSSFTNSEITGIYQGVNGLYAGDKAGEIFKDSSGSFSSLGSGYGTTYHFSFASFYDASDAKTYDLWCNGTTIQKYDGTTVSTVTGSPTSRFLTVFKTRVATAGDPAHPRRLQLCAEANIDDWTTANDWYWIELPMGNDEITGLFTFFNNVTSEEVLFIFGTDHVFALVGDDPTGSYPYRLSAVSNSIGAISHFGISQIGNDLLFWARDGLRTLTSLQEGFKIPHVTKSSNLGSWIESINAARYPYIYSINHAQKAQLFSLIYTGGNTKTDMIPIFDYFNASMNESGQCWTRFKFNTQPSCVARYLDSNKKEWLLTGDFNGDIYKHDVGQSDQSQSYDKYAETKHFDDAIPDWNKFYFQMIFKVKTYGDYNIDITKIFNQKRQPTVAISLTSTDSAIWNKKTWNTFIWGASSINNKTVNLKYVAKSVGFKFTNSDINEQFELQSLILYRELYNQGG